MRIPVSLMCNDKSIQSTSNNFNIGYNKGFFYNNNKKKMREREIIHNSVNTYSEKEFQMESREFIHF